MVVVFGGVGNLLGTLVAGFSLGIANKFLEPFAGAVLAKILVLIFHHFVYPKAPTWFISTKGSRGGFLKLIFNGENDELFQLFRA
jgi:urea transport system permease protein